MRELLEELGGWDLQILEHAAASREGILAALERLEQRLGPEDSVLFYFVGHGGLVEIPSLPPPWGTRVLAYLATHREKGPWHLMGVLDVELSTALARLDARCGNVAVMLDCCYPARTVRGPVFRLDEAPAWLRERAEEPARDLDAWLHPTSHPRIIRLAASSRLRTSYPDKVQGEHLGRLTRFFVEAVRASELRLDRLTWDALVHQLRERAIWRLGSEEQWVSLAGPRQRLIFSRAEGPALRSVGFVPRDDGPGGWLRAGALQGVQLGDRWGIAAPTLDEALTPRWLAHMRVTKVELNRASLEPETASPAHIHGPTLGIDGSPAQSSRALLERRRQPALVDVQGPSELRERVAASIWLAPRSHSAPGERAFAALRQIDGAGQPGLELRSLEHGFPMRRFTDGARAIELLEDWARARTLLNLGLRGDDNLPPSSEAPAVTAKLLRVGERSSIQTLREGDHVHAGERVLIELRCAATATGWFANTVFIDADGRPRLIDEAEIEGTELRPGERWRIGERDHRGQQGLPLPWPAELPTDTPRSIYVVVLASKRPLSLAHLVRAPGWIPPLSPKPKPDRRRGKLPTPRPRTGPALHNAWGAQLLRLELDPRTPTDRHHG
ncbi:hypothetical protein [Pseudenhygromyxa sp. WMMC2535]|uniref:hypothetical protein n=1 Tax=Pseudenhygromyxa sp. WMMC2535 TaxID=2712867 RepID=UPI001551F7EC|nr:hypothetical protein [Pseudenhygromyxa sp. WMMC2535]